MWTQGSCPVRSEPNSLADKKWPSGPLGPRQRVHPKGESTCGTRPALEVGFGTGCTGQRLGAKMPKRVTKGEEGHGSRGEPQCSRQAYLPQSLQLQLRLIIPLLQVEKLRLRGLLLPQAPQLVSSRAKTQVFYS